MKYYLIQTLSQHSLHYLVSTEEAISNAQIQEAIEIGEVKEFNQEFLGEKVVGLREISEAEMNKYVPK